jgi:hypothetical protein
MHYIEIDDSFFIKSITMIPGRYQHEHFKKQNAGLKIVGLGF